jgi:hypothetical protein
MHCDPASLTHHGYMKPTGLRRLLHSSTRKRVLYTTGQLGPKAKGYEAWRDGADCGDGSADVVDEEHEVKQDALNAECRTKLIAPVALVQWPVGYVGCVQLLGSGTSAGQYVHRRAAATEVIKRLGCHAALGPQGAAQTGCRSAVVRTRLAHDCMQLSRLAGMAAHDLISQVGTNHPETEE